MVIRTATATMVRTPTAPAATGTPVVPIATPSPRPSPAPTPTPDNTVTVTALGDGLVLSISPQRPVAGRPVQFVLTGLTGWKCVQATTLDPNGNPADWTSEDRAFVVGANGTRIQTSRLCAGQDGKITWSRLNVLDMEGRWTSQVSVDGKEYRAAYTLGAVAAQTTTVQRLNMSLRRYSAVSSEMYSGQGVPVSLAVDYGAALPFIASRLRPWLPDVYLFADPAQFRSAVTAAGGEVSGLEAGVFEPSGPYRGIYVTVDDFSGATLQVLVHEYVHLLVDTLGPRTETPAWLNEGLARHLETQLGAEYGGSQQGRRTVYTDTDLVQSAAAGGGPHSPRQLGEPARLECTDQRSDLGAAVRPGVAGSAVPHGEIR
jgi:hypothetical protein